MSKKQKKYWLHIPSQFELFTRKLFGLLVFLFLFPLWLPSFSNVVQRESTAVRYSPHLIFGHCQWFIICVSSSPFFGCSCRCFFLLSTVSSFIFNEGWWHAFCPERKKKSRENFMQNARRKWAAENFFIARRIGNGGERGSSSKHIIHSVQLTTCGRGFLKHYWATFMYFLKKKVQIC